MATLLKFQKSQWVDKIRVLLGNKAGALRESLRDLIGQQPDMEVVGEAIDPVALLLAVRESQADVVIVESSKEGEEPAICSHLFAEYPHLRVLVLSPQGHSAALFYLDITKERISTTSDEEITAAIRLAGVEKAH